MKKINTSQSKRTSFLIWLMFLGGVLISMPVKAQSTVSELQQLINEVPVNGTKVLDLGKPISSSVSWKLPEVGILL